MKVNPAAVFATAERTADAAALAATPTPMIVGTAIGLSDRIDPTQRTYVIPDGVCGFAWVRVRPARGAFVTWCKQNNIGRSDSYEGGYVIPAHELAPSLRKTQSYERKMAAANAAAAVLRDAGINAYSEGHLD